MFWVVMPIRIYLPSYRGLVWSLVFGSWGSTPVYCWCTSRGGPCCAVGHFLCLSCDSRPKKPGIPVAESCWAPFPWRIFVWVDLGTEPSTQLSALRQVAFGKQHGGWAGSVSQHRTQLSVRHGVKIVNNLQLQVLHIAAHQPPKPRPVASGNYMLLCVWVLSVTWHISSCKFLRLAIGIMSHQNGR